MNNVLLKVENLKKEFITKSFFKFKKTTFTAVDNISFELNEGEILGILGPNGAGKTTTIQMLLGLLSPTSGSINYFGKNFFKNRSEIMQHVSFASSYLRLPSSLTVQENLNIYARIYSLPPNVRNEQIEKCINFFGLEKIKNKLIKNLSAGQLTRTMLAKAFLPNPKIVLLDEPTAALDPEISLQIRNFILEERKKTNISIIFTSHNMSEVEEICDRVLVLKDGKIIASEMPENLASKVKTSHLKLLITVNFETLINYLKNNDLLYKVNDHYIEIDINEQKIPELLVEIGNLGIKYTEIYIEKPTLEDYFLEIVKK